MLGSRKRGGMAAAAVPANADRKLDEEVSSTVAEITEQNEERLLESLWSNLPEELILRIITWLWIPDVCRLRAVCKRWAFFLSPKPFAAMQQQIVPYVARHLPLFIGGDPYHLNLFCPSRRKRYNVLLTFLPPSVMVKCVAGSESLICILAESESSNGGRRLYVCNPFSKFLRMLPHVEIQSWRTIGMITTTGHHGYKILVVSGPYCCWIFDSISGFWRWTDTPKGIRFEQDSSKEMAGSAICNQIFYCQIEWPHGLISFDMEKEEWSMVRAELPSCLVGTLHLADCEGKLVLTAELSLRGKRSIAVWKLDYERDLWVQVDAMPDEMFKRFKRSNYMTFECIGKGQFLILTANGDSRLMFDMVTNIWEWLPASPDLKFGFYPRFD